MASIYFKIVDTKDLNLKMSSSFSLLKSPEKQN